MKSLSVLSLLLFPFVALSQQAGRINTTQAVLNLKNPPNSIVWADTTDFYKFYASSPDSFHIVLTYNSYSNPAWIASLDYSKLTSTPAIPAAQVNSDWSASSGVAQILNKPVLSTVATTGNYNDLSGKPAIPAAQVNSDWTASSGVTQILNKPALATVATSGAYGDLIGRPALSTVATSGLFADLLSKPTTLSGYGITDAGTVTSVGITSSDFSIGGSPVTSSGNITVNLNASGVTAGSYMGTYTVNNKGVVTAANNPTIDTLSSARSFNTTYQNTTGKYMDVRPCARISCSLSLTGGQEGYIALQTSSDGATWTTMAQLYNSNTGTLTVGLSTVQIGGGQLSGIVPPSYYWRLTTNNVTGTPTYTMLTGNKTIY